MLNSLVSVQWLNQHLNDENLVVLYTTLIAKKEQIPEELECLQIKGARFFDLKGAFSDQNSGLPNTYPSLTQFEEESRKLGINQNSKIVIYDSLGIYASPRVWFLFKSMGHQEVFVLNGGLKEWVKHGYGTINKETYRIDEGDFKASYNSHHVRNIEELKENLESEKALVVDARSEQRFIGQIPEPRAGLRSGNIPNSFNLHYASLLEEGKFKSPEILQEMFLDKLNTSKPLIFSCGSGVTACILYLAADTILDNNLSIYDGSWTEWGSR